MDLPVKKNFGDLIMTVLLILLVVLIFIPIGFFMKSDRYSTLQEDVKHRKELAIAYKAMSLVYDKLVSHGVYEDYIRKKRSIPGYNFDRVYLCTEDAETNQYTAKISPSDKEKDTVKIEVITKSDKGNLKGLRGYYRISSAMGPLWGETINLENNLIVHWGPVYASRRINAGWNVFPRKYSQGEVLNRDANGIEPPNSDYIEWWSYEFLPKFVKIDFAQILQKAKQEKKYYRNTNVVLSNAHDNIFKCWYFEHNLKLTGDFHISGVVVVKGSLELDGLDALSERVYIPKNAWMEYGLIDTAAQNEYPGDVGQQANSIVYDFANKNKIGIRGFLYVEGDLIIHNDHTVYGGCVINGDVLETGKLTIFYDENLQIPVLSKTFIPHEFAEFQPFWINDDKK